jgi:hypothetical protein
MQKIPLSLDRNLAKIENGKLDSMTYAIIAFMWLGQNGSILVG